MNKLICISGTSGVGKTTIANLLSCIMENDSSIIISGDDCHKWERNNEMWKKFTHLNPEANNIELEFETLLKLKNKILDIYFWEGFSYFSKFFLEDRKDCHSFLDICIGSWIYKYK